AIGSTGNLVNTGNISGTEALSVASTGNITTRYGSYIGSEGQLDVSAKNIDNGGSIRGNATNISFSGDSLNVTGNILGYSNLNVKSVKDDKINTGKIYNSGRISGNDVTITTNGKLEQEGNLVGSNSLTIKSDVIYNAYY
ncbi:filamentous hemagglutinin, partial [Klebsiella pneumoniae]|nr:filamentous hemagglutinin [Klebsiella pneumoniae]